MAGAPPQTPLGELTVLPQTPRLNLRGPTKGRGRDGGGRGWEGKEREGTGLHPEAKIKVGAYGLSASTIWLDDW